MSSHGPGRSASGAVIGLLAIAGLLLALGEIFSATGDSIVAQRDQQQVSVRVDAAYAECVEGIEPSWNADFGPCDPLHDATANDDRALDARTLVLNVRARQASRVALDRDKALIAVAKLPPRAKFEHGLLEEYRMTEDFGAPAFPRAAANLDVLFGWGSRVPADAPGLRGDFVLAARCLGDQALESTTADDAATAIACNAHRDKQEVLAPKKNKKGGAELLAELESNPSELPEGFDAVRDPRVRLTAWATLAGQNSPLAAKHTVSRDELGRVACMGAWFPADAFGVPQLFRRAAKIEPELSDRLLLIAARQSFSMGDIEGTKESLAGISNRRFEAICAAQLEIAMGEPEAAEARLGRRAKLEPAFEARAQFTAAEAAFIRKDWPAALKAARSAVGGLEAIERYTANLIIVAASAALGQPDGLDSKFGAVDSRDIGDDAIRAARWYAWAAQNDVDDAIDRWNAPVDVFVGGGAMVPYFFVAAMIAPPQDVEYWLDIVMASRGFDPLDLATARRLAAELAGRDADVERWRAHEKKQRAKIRNLGSTRLWRAIRWSYPH